MQDVGNGTAFWQWNSIFVLWHASVERMVLIEITSILCCTSDDGILMSTNGERMVLIEIISILCCTSDDRILMNINETALLCYDALLLHEERLKRKAL